MRLKRDHRSFWRFGLWLPSIVCISFLLTSNAAAQTERSYANVTLRITIVGPDNAAIDTFEIAIPRSGSLRDGTPLKEIRAIVEKGNLTDKGSPGFKFENHTLVRQDTDFELSGVPHSIKVTATGYEPFSEAILDDALQRASNGDKTLPIPITLKTAGQTATTTSAPGANPSVAAPVVKPESFWKALGRAANYVVWVLGLTGTALFITWVLLVLITKIFSIQAQKKVLRLAPSMAGALVRPFGFRLRFSVNHQMERREYPETLLRSIDNDLADLSDHDNGSVSAADKPQKIVNSLSKLAGSRSDDSYQPYLDRIKTSLIALSERQKSPPPTPVDSQAVFKDAVKEAVNEALEEKGFRPPPPPDASGNAASSARDVALSNISPQLGPSLEARAKTSYQRWLVHQPPDCKPLFLETDAKASILGKLEDDTIYLAQVSSSSAPFLLFIDEGSNATGWVFPNPAQGFDKSTLKDVFPKLTEGEFNDSIHETEPAPVVRADDRRWRVGHQYWYQET